MAKDLRLQALKNSIDYHKLGQEGILNDKNHELLRTITIGLKRTLNDSIVSEKSDWIVVRPSPFHVLRNNALFEHAVFGWR